MEQTTKQFKKRNAIYDCLCNTDTHPSAEMVHGMLHDEHPDISLATVYRNLSRFKAEGKIMSVPRLRVWSGSTPTPPPMSTSSVPSAMRSSTCIRSPCPAMKRKNAAAAVSKAAPLPSPVCAICAQDKSSPEGEKQRKVRKIKLKI